MLNVYDIYLNFTPLTLYLNYFEWEKENIIDYSKIPIVKVNKKTFRDLYNNKVIIDKTFYDNIRLKTKYDGKSITACIFTDGIGIFAMKFNKTLENISRSELQLDDIDDVISLTDNISFTTINYKILENTYNIRTYTLEENRIREYLDNVIEESYKSNHFKLKYIYQEIIHGKTNNIKTIYSDLKKSLCNINKKHIEVYNLLNSIKKVKS